MDSRIPVKHKIRRWRERGGPGKCEGGVFPASLELGTFKSTACPYPFRMTRRRGVLTLTVWQEVTLAAPGEPDDQGAQLPAAFQVPPERQWFVETLLFHTLEGEERCSGGLTRPPPRRPGLGSWGSVPPVGRILALPRLKVGFSRQARSERRGAE